MAARPPPTRPHINLNPPSHFSYSITEWGEDDAWDSTSDSESASNTQAVWGRSLNQPGHPRPSGVTSTSTSTSSSVPKPVPVPRKSQNSSSSTLAFSYTHVSAPSPTGSSPYPSHAETIPPTTMKNGWTIVQKAGEDVRDRAGAALPLPGSQQHTSGAADEADNDMTFEDLGDELFVDMPVVPKVRLGAACVRQDAAEIANGAWPVSQPFSCHCMRWIYTHMLSHRSFTPSYTSCGAAWSCRALIATTLEVVVSAVRGTVGKAEARTIFQGQSSSKVHRMSVARGCGHGFVIFTSFTIPMPVRLGSFCCLPNKLSYENWPGLGSPKNFVRWLGHFSWYDQITSRLCRPSLIFPRAIYHSRRACVHPHLKGSAESTSRSSISRLPREKMA